MILASKDCGEMFLFKKKKEEEKLGWIELELRVAVV